MENKNAFVISRRKEIQFGIRQNIDEHLAILNSEIILPTNKFTGALNELRLLATVKSREKLHTNLYKLIDLAGIDRSSDIELQASILQGMKNSYNEINEKIFLRPMRNLTQAERDEIDEDIKMDEESAESSDDIISSVSDSKIMASEIMNKTLDRIEMLEDPDALNDAKMNNGKIQSIAEQYARR